MMGVALFKEVVVRVKGMCFDFSRRLFDLYLLVIRLMWMSELNRKRKMEAFKSFGWCEDEFLWHS